MISWIRIARGIGDDPKVHAMAAQLDLDVAQVVGHLVFVFGQMVDHAKDGDLRRVPDTALERWAAWTGRRGKFAAAFRASMTTDGVVSAWEKHNGSAIQKAEADAERLRARRASVARRNDDASRDAPATDARASNVRDETRRDEEPREASTASSHPSRRDLDAPAAGEPSGFGAAWAAYPARSGSNPHRDAVRAYRARLGEGYTPDELLAGVQRYARWCDAEGKTATPYVMQAVTFFGPALRFREPWAVLDAVGAGNGHPLPAPEHGWLSPALDRLTDPTRP